MNIPELSINPLAHRLERVFESVNFKVASMKAQLDCMHTNASATVTHALPQCFRTLCSCCLPSALEPLWRTRCTSSLQCMTAMGMA